MYIAASELSTRKYVGGGPTRRVADMMRIMLNNGWDEHYEMLINKNNEVVDGKIRLIAIHQLQKSGDLPNNFRVKVRYVQ